MGHRLWLPCYAKYDERLGFCIDQGKYLKDGTYGIVVQENGQPHGGVLARTVVDPRVDKGPEIVERLINSVKERGYL